MLVMLHQDVVEVVHVTLVGTNTESRLIAALESVIETAQDFTDYRSLWCVFMVPGRGRSGACDTGGDKHRVASRRRTRVGD